MKTEMTLEGFTEISLPEQQEINGGFLGVLARIAVAIASAAAAEIASDWDNFKNGLQGLPEEK